MRLSIKAYLQNLEYMTQHNNAAIMLNVIMLSVMAPLVLDMNPRSLD
jgi:hypothetical protein